MFSMIDATQNTVGERIKKIRKSKRLNQKEFANSIGISQPYLSQLENNAYPLNENEIDAIVNKYSISRAWLIDGQGAPWQGGEKVTPISSNAESINLTKIPILGRVPAGWPGRYESEVIEYIFMPDTPAGSFGLVVKGNSMVRPDGSGIHDGDYILFINDSFSPGDVVVANNEWGESMVKRYQVDKDEQPWLVSDNDSYKPIKVTEGFIVIGKVVKKVRYEDVR